MNQMEAPVKAGASPHPIHDERYNADIYPATIDNAVVDIMVPAHGKLNLTMQCINSIYSFTVTKFHLIVCDDSPRDDYGLTEQWIRSLQQDRPNLTYCKSLIPFKDGNTFFNLALRQCRTPYMATVMNSVTVEPQWELAALKIMNQDPKVGSIGFKCLFPWGLIESAGIAFNGHVPTDTARDFAGYRCNEIREAVAVQWAFALHRVAALEGNLEEGVFNGHVGWDDIDNNFCLKAKGWKILYCGQGVGIHYPRATRGSNSIDAHVMNQQNAQTFYKRWGMMKQVIEGAKMDVSTVLSYETKDKLRDVVTRIQVLNQLLKEAQSDAGHMVGSAMKEIGVNPEQYQLEIDALRNSWMLRPKADAILANQQVVPLKPAGDTQASADVIEAVAEEAKAA